MQENILKSLVVPCGLSLIIGFLLPLLLPKELMLHTEEMISSLFLAYSGAEPVVWQSFGSVYRSFGIWLLILWCSGWVPARWPGVLVIAARAMLLGFVIMLLCRVDYGYGLLTGILLLLPGEIFLLGTLLLLCIPAQNMAISIKKREPCFSLRRYLALGMFCLLPAAFGSWLKTGAGPWFLQLVLGLI